MGLLDGQVAIITGAGQGIGKAIALEFAQEGAAVALLEINPNSVEQTQSEITSLHSEARVYVLDITDYAAYAQVVEDVITWKGRIDILVNNAAISLPGTILDDSLENWRKQMAVDLEAVYMGCKLVTPHMVKRNYGRIISITSVQGFVSSGDVGAYNAAKGGIIAYTKSMAVELGQYNVLVNAVAPGFVRTAMSMRNGEDETAAPEFIEWYVNRGKIPLRRVASPEDISGTVVFLASGYCRYMTGQVLVVDGGMTCTF